MTALWLGVCLAWLAVPASAQDDRFALQLEHGVGDGISQAAEDGETVALWAWVADHGAAWPEHCIVSVKEPEWEPAAERVDVLAAYIAQEDRGELDASTSIALPMGQASRFDYRWSATSGGSDFVLVEGDQQIILTCSDHDLGDADGVATKRGRWLEMAESLRFLSADDGAVAIND